MTIRLLLQLIICLAVGMACQIIQWITWKIICLLTFDRIKTWQETQFDYLRENSDGRCDAFDKISSSNSGLKAVEPLVPGNKDGFVNEKEMTEISRKETNTHDMMDSDELIAHAKAMLKDKFGAFGDQDKWLTDDFVFIFPLIYMPDKNSFFDVIKAGGDPPPNEGAKTFMYGWEVDCFEPNRVWYNMRQTIIVKGKWTPLAVQRYSLSFCPKTGKCYKFTGGYVTDRTNHWNNAGGLGAVMGIIMAYGVRFPAVEGRPYYPSLEFRSWLTFLYGVLEIWKARDDAGIYERPFALAKRAGECFGFSSEISNGALLHKKA